ncbi:MAG: hypothetical protein Kow0069_04300 [Promethearchaeota archaeon]
MNAVVTYNISGVGTVELDKKNVECDFSVSADEFFEHFADLLADVSANAKNVLRSAIDSGKRQKIKREHDELASFLEKAQAAASVPGVTEARATSAAEAFGEPAERERPAAGTGEGVRAQVVITETRRTHQTHAGLEIPEDLEVGGELKIVNPSEVNRLWDVKVTLGELERTDLSGGELSVRELDPASEHVQSFAIEDDKSRPLELDEFVSTVGSPEQEAYFLKVGEENPMYFRLELRNAGDAPLRDVEVKKLLPGLLTNVEVTPPALGTTEVGAEEGAGEGAGGASGRRLLWSIPELGAGETAMLELRATATVDDVNARVDTGAIEVKYAWDASLSGLTVENFSASSDSSFFLDQDEMDEKPDTFLCRFVFHNSSEFFVRLLSAEVFDPADPERKFVDFAPPEDQPVELSSGAEWASEEWKYDAPKGEVNLRSGCNFTVVHEPKVVSSGILSVDSLELGVAQIVGELTYDAEVLDSYRETEFTATHVVKNTGGTPLNDVQVQEVVQEGFKPPAVDSVQVFVNDEPVELDSVVVDPSLVPEEAKAEEEAARAAAEEAGEEFEPTLPTETKTLRDLITVEPADQESSPAHTVLVDLSHLKYGPLKAFNPGDAIRVVYPLVADKPEAGQTFTSDVVYRANTDPRGAWIEVQPEVGVIEIPVEHVRKKLRKGKEIRATGPKGQYRITLFFKNTGEYAVPKVTVRDKVPDNFEYSEMSVEPQITDLEGEDVLEWTFEDVQPGQEEQITYVITGSGEYKASDAQFTM